MKKEELRTLLLGLLDDEDKKPQEERSPYDQLIDKLEDIMARVEAVENRYKNNPEPKDPEPTDPEPTEDPYSKVLKKLEEIEQRQQSVSINDNPKPEGLDDIIKKFI